MECEVCGKNVSELKKVTIDSTQMNVCGGCAGLGKEAAVPVKIRRRSPENYEIEERNFSKNYHQALRLSRERMQLTQEEAARKAGVPISVLKRIESGKLEPDDATAKRLERFFRVRIISRTSDEIMDLLDK